MDLRWAGPCWGQSGYEQLTRGLVIALDKLGVQVELIPDRIWNMERIKLESEDRERLIRMATQKVNPKSVYVCNQRPKESHPEAKKRVCYTLFETSECPHPWIVDFKKFNMDKIWVFSEFNKQHWEPSFIENEMDGKIDIIPFGIDTDIFSPDKKKAEIKNKKGFMFVTVGDFTERKNFEGLIEAFVTEFNNEDDVALVMKAHQGGFVRRYQGTVAKQIKEIADRFNPKNPPKILFIGSKITEEDMVSLYNACDCFVLASRGEGLCLPIIEAMACELPIVATGWSAQTDYLTEENSLLVSYDLKQIDDIEYIQRCPVALNHSWAHPHIDDLKEKMRWIYEFKEEAKKKGIQARKDIIGKTWQKAALAIIRKVLEME